MRRSRIAYAAGLSAAVLMAPSLAAASPLFDALPGVWVGTGTVVKSDDTTESLRCKVKYSLAPSGSAVHQELLCAADSYRINFVTDLINQDGRLVGTWKEVDRQASGGVTGTIEGDMISTKVAGNGFRAAVVITVEGPKQSIVLTSDSGNYAKAVRIALKAQ